MEDWIIGIILALFVVVPCWLALARRRQIQLQVDAWPEVARRTGLSFDPNIFNIPKPLYHYPGLRGEYRGHSLSVKLFADSERNEAPNTITSIDTQNYASFSLCVQAKSPLEYIHQITRFPSENPDFDRRFSVIGSPDEYVQGAVDLVVRSEPRLLAWILRSFPTIELKRDSLICRQHREFTNVDDQIALLDLLCDIADLAERMGSGNIIYNQAAGENRLRDEEQLK